MNNTYKPFNFNHNVKVKLNKSGLEELERQHHELYNRLGKPKKWVPPKTDEEGYVTFQMWSLCSTFGNLMTLGDEPPFKLGAMIELKERTNMNKPLPTKPFVNPLITENCYVDVQGWTETEVKLAAEIFAKSTGRKIWDCSFALTVHERNNLLQFDNVDGEILVGSGEGLTCTKLLTKDQVFWPELPTQPDFPDFDFKLSCGDRPEVRQWLKYNGCRWSNGKCLLSVQTDEGFLYVENHTVTWDHRTDWLIDSRNLPEIQPTFTVTGFTVPESEKKRKETLDKIKEKKDTIKRLTDEINQLKQENQTND